MELDELYNVVSRWYETGHIAGTDFQRLKTEYMTEQGFDESKCTTCPDFPRELQHYFLYKLKTLNRRVMAANKKYILADWVGSIGIPGTDLRYTSETLTDQVAEDLLKSDLDYKEQILKNPDYEAPKAAKVEKTESDKK